MTDAPAEREDRGLWQRLRRRKVGQWAIAYVAGAWGFLQGLQYTSGLLHWPEQLQKLAGLALLIGLPIVIVVAWFHGEGGGQRVTRAELAILTLLFLLGGGLFWRFQHAATPLVAADRSSTLPAAGAAPADHSIAVLPFVNMSPDASQEYFADGIAEELLNLLARIPQLRVISRSSAFSFKGRNLDVTEIARQLHVRYVLEGSVRKAGDQVRISTQLVDARSDTQLWAETYDRPLDNIFAVQDDIAAAVVSQLKLKLLGAAPTARAIDPKAFALYLQGRYLMRQGTREGFGRSLELFRQALGIQPDYPAAWDGLARDYTNEVNSGARPIDEGYRLAREAADRALAIDPDFAPAHSRMGVIAMNYDGDLAAAARHFERALQLAPTSTDIIGNAAVLAHNLGRVDESIALGEYVTARDPVNPTAFANLGFSYQNAGRLDDAIASYRTVLALSPDYDGANYATGVALLLKGDAAGGLQAMQKETGGWGEIGLPMAWYAVGDQARSDAALESLIRTKAADSAYNIAYVLAYRGETDRAFEWLEKAARYRDPGLAEIAVEPLFANLRSDPRWLPFLRRLGMAPEQLAAIEFVVKVPD
ncbi:MAG: tetratricopeptide repeat protein [Steroidobacteraceae bacterium]